MKKNFFSLYQIECTQTVRYSFSYSLLLLSKERKRNERDTRPGLLSAATGLLILLLLHPCPFTPTRIRSTCTEAYLSLDVSKTAGAIDLNVTLGRAVRGAPLSKIQ